MQKLAKRASCTRQNTAAPHFALAAAHVRCAGFPDDTGVKQLASLSRLTHLDLGCADGVAALAACLPNLQSLALHLAKIHPSVRTLCCMWSFILECSSTH